jgi:uncharacterized protein
MRALDSCLFLSLLTWLVGTGLVQPTSIMGSTWHQKCGWKADDFFDDPQVIALCHAIEANDIAEIDRLVAAGADVKAQGKGKMTPLLWAFPDNKLERFKRLLEHGSNPNVVITSDFNTRGGMRPGDSVTHMACKTEFPGYFEAVFDHGGDPNLIKNGLISKQTPLFTVITGRTPNKLEKIKFLIDKGVDLNHVDGGGATPFAEAVGRGFYNIALQLLEAGADRKKTISNSTWRLVHLAVLEERRRPYWSPEQKEDYQKLMAWFEKHGESTSAIRAEMNSK